MKTYIKIPVIALGLFISEMGFSAHSNLFEAKVVDRSSFRLDIRDVQNGVDLKIKDQHGQILYKEHLQGFEGYHKIINLSTLPKGAYQLELEYAVRIQVLPIIIEPQIIKLKEGELIEMFKPMVRQQKSRVSISMLNTRQVPLKVHIYDQDNQLIYEDVLNSDLILGKQYDLSKIDSGIYTVRMSTGKRSFSQSIVLP